MINNKLFRICTKRTTRAEHGVTLIEAVIGIALLSIVVVAVLAGVSTAFKADAVADKQSTAMSLAISQIEDLQLQAYDDAFAPPEATYAKISNIPTNFSIWSYNRSHALVSVDSNGVEGVIGIPWKISENTAHDVGVDDGLQKITVVIKHLDDIVLEVETYKVK